MGERTWNAQTVPLVWETPRPPIDGIEGRIRAEIQADLEDLAVPSDLVFHSIWLEDDPRGPTVMAYGREGSDAFHLDYSERTEWVSMQEPFNA